jgi:hypothetical protein
LFYVNPVPAMADVIWGQGFGNILNFVGAMSGLIAALAAVTASSRVIQKLGEDEILPKAFAKANMKSATPIAAISLIVLITLVLGNFTPWEVIAYTIAAGALPAFIITNLLSFWNYKSSLLQPKRFIINGILPWIGIVLSAWFILVGIPTHLKWVLAIWIFVGIVMVFLNTTIRPKAFGDTTKSRFASTTGFGLLISIILLIIVALSFNYWLSFYSSSVQWWHIIAPYALSDIIATVSTVGISVVFFAIMSYSLLRRKGGE